MILLLPVLGLLSGCAFNLNRWSIPNWNQPACVLPENPTATEVVAHLNERASRLQSWRSTSVQIRAQGQGMLLVPLGASIAVENPLNFRLQTKVLSNVVADFGSNSERFWFWIKGSEPKRVFFARHDQLEQVQRWFPIPFQPEWMIEALGVGSLNELEWELSPDSIEPGSIRLVSEQQSPGGELVRKIIVVDACHGYPLGHELYDSQGQLIAKASLSNHAHERDSGLQLPHRIRLEWPRRKMVMTLNVGRIQTNPPPEMLSDSTWQMYRNRNYPPLDLGQPNGSSEPFPRSSPINSQHEPAGFQTATDAWDNQPQRFDSHAKDFDTQPEEFDSGPRDFETAPRNVESDTQFFEDMDAGDDIEENEDPSEKWAPQKSSIDWEDESQSSVTIDPNGRAEPVEYSANLTPRHPPNANRDTAPPPPRRREPAGFWQNWTSSSKRIFSRFPRWKRRGPGSASILSRANQRGSVAC